VQLAVWAPFTRRAVEVVPAGTATGGGAAPVLLAPQDGRPGWYAGEVGWLRHGIEYFLVVDGGDPVPDPRARRLPSGVNGPSQAWDAGTHVWHDAAWSGRPLADCAVVYELHVGTFTVAGTLDAAAEHLPYLRDLGVTHVELMPLAAFAGTHGWGYDSVALDAVHEPYGGPDALCRFVDAAHGRGLAVLLDVVQNHLGPSGNHWDVFGPFLTEEQHTPWGAAVNLDEAWSDDVRAILVGSSVRWLTDFHLDGLRLDALHALRDDRAVTYPEELAAAVDALADELGRPLALVAETDRNDPSTVLARQAGGGGLGLTAQWDDDVHHALHWLLTDETQEYYADFASPASVAHALERAFLHDGRWSSFRRRTHGRPVDWARTDPWRFVVSAQTHDQVGNRALGERIAALAGRDGAACAAALLLTLPYTPLLFMGEEWGETRPWQFFTSFPDAQLGTAVTAGRRREFARRSWAEDGVPDPQDPATFERSRLDPAAAATTDPQMVRWYRDLLTLRRTHSALGPAQRGPGATAGGLRCSWSNATHGRLEWFMVARDGWRIVVNLAAEPVVVRLGSEGTDTDVVLAWRDDAAPVDGDPQAVRLGPRCAAVVRVRELGSGEALRG
jgi:maltooligosyltrehalose trehalohydrolase